MSSWRLLLLLAATPCILAAGQRLSGSASAALPQLPLGEPLSGRRGARQWWPGPLGVWGCSRCRPYQGPSPCQRAETKGSYWEVGKASQTPRDPVVAPTPVPSMCPCLPPRLPLFSASSLACCRPLWCPTALPSRCPTAVDTPVCHWAGAGSPGRGLHCLPPHHWRTLAW